MIEVKTSYCCAFQNRHMNINTSRRLCAAYFSPLISAACESISSPLERKTEYKNNRKVIFLLLLLQPSVRFKKRRQQQKVDGIHLLCFHGPTQTLTCYRQVLSASWTAFSLDQALLSTGPVYDVTWWQVNNARTSGDTLFISVVFFLILCGVGGKKTTGCTFTSYFTKSDERQHLSNKPNASSWFLLLL